MKKQRSKRAKSKATPPKPIVMVPGESGRSFYSSPELAASFAALERTLIREQ